MRAARRLAQKLAAPLPALPVDLFRIGTGITVLGYLVRVLLESRDFHATDGIIDHALGLEIFPFAWQPLFLTSSPLWLIYILLVTACVGSVGIIIGKRPRFCAFVTYVIVVCSLRHRFLVISIDDVIVHLLLFWLILLPSGKTLAWSACAEPRSSWRSSMIPGATVRLFTMNIAVLYFVAGITKWASPLWLQGDALYTVLKLRPAYFANNLTISHLEITRLFNYATLVLEPLLALIPFLPKGNRFKLFLGGVLLILHLGIITTLDVPFANLACLTFLPILFRHEIVECLNRRRAVASSPKSVECSTLKPIDGFAAVVVCFIIGAMASSMTQVNWRKPTQENLLLASAASQRTADVVGGFEQKLFFGGLWAVGLIQQYRLLDWIDERNFQVDLTVTETSADGTSRTLPGTYFVPGNMRGSLTLAYLVGATWLPVPASQLIPLRERIHTRLAHRYASRTDAAVGVQVRATVKRINPSNPSAPQNVELTSFRCANQTVVNHQMNLEL